MKLPLNNLCVDTAIEALQQRISAPSWQTMFEHSRASRVDDSGEWLLQHPLLSEVLRERQNRLAGTGANVLFVKGRR